MHTLFVDDPGATVAEIAARGLEPAEREIYSTRSMSSGSVVAWSASDHLPRLT